MSELPSSPRLATAADAGAAAGLLDAFNREFATPSPGPLVLEQRLERLLTKSTMIVVLTGDPPIAIAVLTLRPSLWYDGPVAVLDELYVAPTERGRGLGSELLAAAESSVRARGGELMEINVDAPDADARRFYERHGYSNTEAGQPLLYYYRELGAS